MKPIDNHLEQAEMIEYFYNESLDTKRIEDHLDECQSCHEKYSDLKNSMESFSEHFREDFWRIQRKKIMSEVRQIKEIKDFLQIRWLKPISVSIGLIIILFAGIYFKMNYPQTKYTENDRAEEMILENVAKLANQPLTFSLDYLSFQEEDLQESEYIVFSEELEIFGYWPDLET